MLPLATPSMVLVVIVDRRPSRVVTVRHRKERNLVGFHLLSFIFFSRDLRPMPNLCWQESPRVGSLAQNVGQQSVFLMNDCDLSLVRERLRLRH